MKDSKFYPNFIQFLFVLGKMYIDGRGVPQDYHKGIEYYLQAANQGDDSALYNLGTSTFIIIRYL